jgi:hypothetical protein
MKFTKIHLLGFAIVSSLSLVSCDSATPVSELDSSTNLGGIADSETTLIIGDEFAYTSVTTASPVISLLTMFTTTNAEAFGTPVYSYLKTGDKKFELLADYNAQDNLDDALEVSLKDPSPQGTRLRELLLRTDAIFSAAEIQEIIDLLNPSGADLSVKADDPTQFVAASRRQIFHEVTSTNRDLLAGVQSGVYKILENSFEITFRNATSDDLAKYRLLSALTKIPVVTTTIFAPTAIEEGRWVLSFTNG